LQDKILTANKTKFGASYNEETKSIDFRLFSLNAQNVVLCIFEKPEGEDAVMNFEMTKKENGVWETSVKVYVLGNLKRPFYYGYRLFGPNWVKKDDFEPGSSSGFRAFVDENNNRFNPNKIAYDPYSLEISHLPSKNKGARVNLENYTEDNQQYAPKSVFFLNENIEIPKVTPYRAFKDEIIGEVHLKDLTALSDFEEKGTYAGASKMARKLKEMGLTTIEFLPLTEFDDENNHWGYMPLSYFALAKKYSYSKEAGSALWEFRNLVKIFHENGLKVCLDMVYNHTGEAKIYDNDVNDANLLSYALIDNATYYKQTPNNYYTCYSCCNNDFNIANKPVQDLIIDSLEFWAKQGVDAFRFDLAAALMDKDSGVAVNYDKYDGFVVHIKDELERRGVKVLSPTELGDGITLIAEPWSCSGSNCYQLGNFPPYWCEWNDVARNTLRANTISPQTTDPLGLRNLIEGAPFCFGDNLKSINYIASHDGFTLNDLNSYDKKNQTTNGGSDWELCSSYLGDSEKQEKAMKKQLALLLLSKGIPMLQVGDFIAHSKLGNNNSYDLDNRINYLNFLNTANKQTRAGRIYDFLTSMIKFRKAHKVLSDENYNHMIDYYGPNAFVVPNDNLNYWQNTNADYFSFKTNGDDVIFCAVSKAKYSLEVKLPANNSNKKWFQVLDISKDNAFDIDGIEYNKENFILEPDSLCLFVEK